MEKIQPLVSFIIPCYNLPPEMVTECVTSILNLSMASGEREIIVIDDGSEEVLIDKISHFSDKIRYVRQENKGLSESRNVGMRMSKGKYIQFVDGDDKIIKDGYEYCLDIVRHDEPDMVVFNFSDKENKKSNSISYDIFEHGTEFLLKKSLRAAACKYVFKKDILSDLKFTKGIYHEDEEFTPLLMLGAKKVYETNSVAYYYRRRQNSIMNSRDKNIISKRLDDMEYVILSLDGKKHSYDSDERKALERRVAQLTEAYIYQIMKLTHSSKQLEECIRRLSTYGLFPLPDNKYNWKYSLFRALSGKKTLRDILLIILR